MTQSHALTSWVLALALTFTAHGAFAAGAAGASNPAAPVGPIPVAIPAPTNLVFATDPASCDKFRIGVPPKASDPCKDLANRPNSGTFHWDWPGNNPHPLVFGFKLYRVDSNRHELVIGPTVKAVDGNTAILFNSVVPWACYAVSAYNLTDESPLSPQLCLGAHLEPVAPPSPTSALAIAPQGAQMALPMTPQSAARATPPPTLPIPPPSRLVASREHRVCAAHGGPAGSAACQSLLPKGGLALLWDYAPSHIDGFRAYSIPPGTNAPAAGARVDTASGAAPVQQAAPTPVATQTNRLENGSVATLVVLEPRPRGFANECFAVTAFAGGQESPMSATVCVPPVAPMGEGRALHKD